MNYKSISYEVIIKTSYPIPPSKKKKKKRPLQESATGMLRC